MNIISSYKKILGKDPHEIYSVYENLCAKISKSDPAWIVKPSMVNIKPQIDRLFSKIEVLGIEHFSLFGIPIAVKDNIDVEGFPTTAACPGFSYIPQNDAFAIAKLREAGAIFVGKTNMDQFATGLNGTRSPYGIVPNPFHSQFISGGSSSGSASAVARYQVPISIGTDTAGSGRVPAGYCNIFGLKPSLGLVSKTGLVPACKSIDTISVFAHSAHDLKEIADVIYAFDEKDPYSCQKTKNGDGKKFKKFAIPKAIDKYVSAEVLESFRADIGMLTAKSYSIHEIDISPFIEFAKELYEGPFLAERMVSFGHEVLSRNLEVLPVISTILSKADKFSASDLFRAQERRKSLTRLAEKIFSEYDALLIPTVTAHFEISEIEADPILKNSYLGTFTNFVNLINLAAIAIPSSFAKNGLPVGLTLVAPAMSDDDLIQAGDELSRVVSVGSGVELIAQSDQVDLVVVGAHLSGMPLNYQLTERNARLIEVSRTANAYTLYALENQTPVKPGLIKKGSSAIELEVWRMPISQFGSFVDLIPSPLGIGRIELEDGREVQGFICEPYAIEGMPDISSFGGFRKYLANKKATK